jgi:hypothetical protein
MVQSIFFSEPGSVSSWFTSEPTMYKPGQLLSATVDGERSTIYLTMDQVIIDDDGNLSPRFKLWPSHSMIPETSAVHVGGPVESMSRVDISKLMKV